MSSEAASEYVEEKVKEPVCSSKGLYLSDCQIDSKGMIHYVESKTEDSFSVPKGLISIDGDHETRKDFKWEKAAKKEKVEFNDNLIFGKDGNIYTFCDRKGSRKITLFLITKFL